MNRKTEFLLLLVIVSTIFLCGCTQPQQVVKQTPQPTAAPTQAGPTGVPSSDTIGTTSSSLGTILVDAQRMTLYYLAKDIAGNDESTCYGQCEVYWPIFSVDTITVSPPLTASDFSSITRTDGNKQTTYRGWPLYYYQGDKRAGDLMGENVTNNWFVIRPDDTVMISQKGSLGSFLTDKDGKTLYFFAKDTPMVSTCTDACLAKWPPFNADPVVAPSILKTTEFTAVTRADGVKQTAFMGKPLYYYVNDTLPGDMKGQGLNNVWFVANVTGSMPVMNIPPSPTPTAVQMSVPSGGGYRSGY